MFISVFDLFKIGIGPSSSHTMGPLIAAARFHNLVTKYFLSHKCSPDIFIRCIFKGSLAYTGKEHAADYAVILGLNNYSFADLANKDIGKLIEEICERNYILINKNQRIQFSPKNNIIFDKGKSLQEHPNGMIFELVDQSGKIILSETYFSIGGGFIKSLDEIKQFKKTKILQSEYLYPFNSADSMLQMSVDRGLSISDMKRINERKNISDDELNHGLDVIWTAMRNCVKRGLSSEGILPGKIKLVRRAKSIYNQLQESPETANVNDWLCAYAMAVSEENAAGHTVVTAPTNGAAGVIPAILYYFVTQEHGTIEQVREFLLTAGAICGIIKHRSSISGAEVGCQGEIGSAAAMAAAGLCAVRGGTPRQIENAAEIALEHHLGMTCDPVDGLVQVPCIERNCFSAIKAYTAASLAMRGNGQHFMSLDNCIAAMKQTGLEMSEKYKETSLGGLAVSITEC